MSLAAVSRSTDTGAPFFFLKRIKLDLLIPALVEYNGRNGRPCPLADSPALVQYKGGGGGRGEGGGDGQPCP